MWGDLPMKKNNTPPTYSYGSTAVPEEASKYVICAKDIVKSFYVGTPNELEILHGMTFNVPKGEFVSIVGQSGSGKSTLMNIIGALDRPTSGSYFLDGIDVSQAKDKEKEKQQSQLSISKADLHKLVQSARVELSNSK